MDAGIYHYWSSYLVSEFTIVSFPFVNCKLKIGTNIEYSTTSSNFEM